MEISTVHYAAIFITIGLSLGYTVYSAITVKSAEGFSLVGRAANAPLVAGGIVGVIIGGGATVGTAQMAYQLGLAAWAYSLGAGIAFIIQGIFYARPLRRTNLETVPEFFGLHYGKYAAPLVSLCGTLSMLFGSIAGVIAGTAIIAAILKIDAAYAAALLCVLVIMTVFFSGQKGSSISGIIKMGILWIGLLVGGAVAVFALYDMPNFSEIFPRDPWLNLFSRGVGEVSGNIFSMIVGILCSQNYIQALYSASDAKTASIGAFVAAAIVIPIGLPIVGIGMYMHAQDPTLTPILAMPTFFFTYLPDWFGGIAIAGPLLAIIGSTAGQALGMGTLISRDFVGNLFQVKSNNVILWANRTAVLVLSIFVAYIAYMNRDATVLEWNFMGFILRGGGVFIPLTLAIFKPGWLSPSWAIVSIICSTAVALISKLVLDLPVNPLYLAFATSIAIIALGILVSGKQFHQQYGARLAELSRKEEE